MTNQARIGEAIENLLVTLELAQATIDDRYRFVDSGGGYVEPGDIDRTWDNSVAAARLDLRRLQDAALIVRHVISTDDAELAGVSREWSLTRMGGGPTYLRGPIVNGLPVLDETARRALEGT